MRKLLIPSDSEAADLHFAGPPPYLFENNVNLSQNIAEDAGLVVYYTGSEQERWA